MSFQALFMYECAQKRAFRIQRFYRNISKKMPIPAPKKIKIQHYEFEKHKTEE